MRRGLIVLLSALLVAAYALPAMADISFFGTAKVKPTYYDNFDFDDNAKDLSTTNEAGFTKGEHVRAELRLGWKAGGDNWSVFFITESDLIYEKDTVDRSFFSSATKGNSTNAGGEFGIERFEATYTFAPWLTLATGWNIRAADIRTGGVLHGDDHPYIEFNGKLAENLKYALTYIIVQNREDRTLADSTIDDDWRVYMLKADANVGAGDLKFTLSPTLLYSDNRSAGNTKEGAKIYYYGIEALGQIGIFKPSFEFFYADGEFRNSPKEISSYAAFAGVEAALHKAFIPYVAARFTRGDDDLTDDDVEGFNGITDIARFTPLMGMDGNILGEHLSGAGISVLGAPLYSYAPERAVGGDGYGGISSAASGNNPGQILVGFGAKGNLGDFVPNLSYKTQVFLFWYDETDNLVNLQNPGSDVDDYAGTGFDLQLKYDFSKNFAIDYIFSTFIPGDGIKDQLPLTADDTIAQVHSLTLAWTY